MYLEHKLGETMQMDWASQMVETWAESFLPVNAPQECKIPKP